MSQITYSCINGTFFAMLFCFLGSFGRHRLTSWRSSYTTIWANVFSSISKSLSYLRLILKAHSGLNNFSFTVKALSNLGFKILVGVCITCSMKYQWSSLPCTVSIKSALYFLPVCIKPWSKLTNLEKEWGGKNMNMVGLR